MAQQQQPAFPAPQPQQAYVQPQAPSQPQNQHLQQFAGQYGTYTQVTADSCSQPAVSPAFVSRPPAEPVTQVAASADFGAPAAKLTGAALFGVESVGETDAGPAKMTGATLFGVESVGETDAGPAKLTGAALFGVEGVDETDAGVAELPPPPPPAEDPGLPAAAEETSIPLPEPPAEVVPQVEEQLADVNQLVIKLNHQTAINVHMSTYVKMSY
jgi:hypothetical protein